MSTIILNRKPYKVKNEISKKKKRKFEVMNGDIVDESDDKQLKKRKVNNNIDYSNQTQNKKSLMKYTNTETYAKAIANPDFVQLVPKIFQQNLSKQIKNEQSNSLVFNIVRKSLNSEVNKRFYYPTNTNNLENVESKNSNKIGVKQSVPQIIEKFNTPSVKEYEKKKNDVAVLKPEVTSKLSKHENKINQNIKIDNICVDKEISRDSNIVSFADFYEVSDKEGIIFHLHHPCKFSFYGALKFTLITGEIEILGFTLRKSSSTKSIITYSPEINIPMVVETKSVMQEQPKKEIRKSLKGILSQDSTNQLLNYFNANDAILLVEQVFSTFSPIAEKYMSLQIFPNNLENLSLESDALKKLQSTFKFGSNARKQFMKNEEWEQIPLNQCTILCGGKGVGKSTLLRFYVNQAISQDEKILVLDFDPGQPEFTPPGYLSAVIADKPLLGPNFTHVTEGLIMVYYGGVSTNQSPSKYLECVEYVIEWCRKDKELSKMKWLVNTMGFCKGLGVELIISILKLLKPNTVIQIQSSDNQNNYPFHLTPNAVNNKEGFRSMKFRDNLYYEFWTINSSAEINHKRLHSELTSAELRNLMMLSYLSQMLSQPYYNFNAVQPYVISFSKLYLGIDFSILPSDVLKAFNGSIISLSHFERTSEVVLSVDDERDDYFKIVIKPPVTPSFGLGFVRGIDCENKMFYVLTHLCLDKLDKVNCLTLGRISPPGFLFLKQESIKSSAVYTSLSTFEAVQEVKRKFRK